MKVGFIGCGNMGTALSKAVASTKEHDIYLSNRTKEKADALAKELGAISSTNEEIFKSCSYIFLCIKPQNFKELLSEYKNIIQNRKDSFVLISIAAGITIDTIAELTSNNIPIIRMMPNLPASIGVGMTLICKNSLVKDSDIKAIQNMLKASGKTDLIEEELMDIDGVINGCSPAYTFLFINSLAEGAKKYGVDENKALMYAAQTVLGSAELLLNSEKTPDELIKAVCSPGGTTIEGINHLKNNGFEKTVADATEKSYLRSKELGKK